MHPAFSIVVPALNVRGSLDVMFRCLEAQSVGRDAFECVVVDDGSTDGSAEYFERHPPRLNLRYIRNAAPRGRAEARNTGWQQSAGDVVVFLDGDMIPSPDLLQAYHTAFETGAHVVSGSRHCIDVDPHRDDLADHLSAICGCAPSELFVTDVGGQMARLHRSARQGPYPSAVWARLEQQLHDLITRRPDSLMSAYGFITSNVAVERRRLEETRGFDCFLSRMEDTDLGIRLFHAGARFAAASGAMAYHQWGPRQAGGDFATIDRDAGPAARGAPSGGPAGDRAYTAEQYTSFFTRHPYHDVLLMYLWFAHNSQAAPAAPPFDSLTALASLDPNGDHAAGASATWQAYTRLVPLDCRHTAAEIAAYYNEVYGIPEEHARRYLAEAVAQRVYTVSKRGTRYYDVRATSNWLRQHTTFQEEVIRTISYARFHKTPFQQSGDAADVAQLHCAGRYEVAFTDLGQGARVEAVLEIPIPVEHPNQTGVRFTACEPPDLLDYLEAGKGIMRYPWPVAAGDVRISYDFSCAVREAATSVPRSAAGVDDARYLEPFYPPAFSKKVDALRRRILGDEPGGDWAIARTLYLWILDHTILCETALPDFSILDHGLGGCVHQARLFIALCRSLGIPARERCGALLGRLFGSPAPVSLETRGVEVGPFTHTWAEIHLKGRGWVAVEFVAWGTGRRALTSRNVSDPDLRRTLVDETSFYDDYFFGSLDPYRIYACDGANRLQPHAVGPALAGRGRPPRLGRAHHRIACRYTNLSD